MLQLQSNRRRKRYAYMKASVHVFNEIIKTNRVEFHGSKCFVEEAKTPARTFYSNNTFIKSSNLLEPLSNINSYSDAIVTNKKYIICT